MEKLASDQIKVLAQQTANPSTSIFLPTHRAGQVSGRLQPNQLITHHFTLDEVMQAYDTFSDAMKEEALKVIIANGILLEKLMQGGGKKAIPFPVAK
jgi:alcohol dehydrogenase